MASRKHRAIRKHLLILAAAISLVVAAGSSHFDTITGTAYAQVYMATLSGTVTDEAGAVIPSVNITLLNLSTALERHATTDDSGYYVVPLLPPGSYNVTAQRTGFSTLEVRNVTLNTGDQLALKIKLKVGEIGETVTVKGEDSVTQQGLSVATVVNRQLVENLPLNGRGFQSLFELAPGTVLTKATFNEQGQFSVNGQRANANYFMIDGVSANMGVNASLAPGQAATGALPALTTLGGTNNLVSTEALEEFRIFTSSYAPEFGRTPGAQVSIVTRSGTNAFHGTVFDYLRNDRLDANDFFANSRGLGKGALRQNDFGGVVGGPLARDRAFFFFSYEGLRLRQPQFAVTEVPSAASRLQAPLQFRPLLSAFPLPNGADFQNGFAEFAASYSDPSSLNATSIRVDFTASKRMTVFARYNNAPSETVQRGGISLPGFNAQSLNTLNHTFFKTQTFTAGTAQSITQAVFNDLRVNWSRATGSTFLTLDDFGGAVVPPASLLFPPFADTETSGFQFILRGGLNSNFGSGKIADNSQTQLNFIDTLSVIRGQHQIKLGVDYRRLSPTYRPLTYSQSVILGNGNTNGVGAALNGQPFQIQISAEAGARHPLFTNFSAFAQDTWQVTPKLALTYGLRWEVNPPPAESNGNPPFTVQGIDFDDLGTIISATGGNNAEIDLAPRGKALWKTTYYNFAPRVGMAYQLSQSAGTVIRGGTGIFYDLGNSQASASFGSVFPFARSRTMIGTLFPLPPDAARPPELNLEPPFNTIYAFDPRLKLPYTVQWNATVEQPLGSQQTLAISYVGAVGHRLLRETAVLNPNPKFTVLRVVSNTASSNYQALQAQLQRRMTKGLQLQASYTWARSVDDDSDDSSTNFFRDIKPEQERGPSNFDVRHSFTAALSYNVPLLLKRGGHLSRALLRNWSVDAIFRARTATPLNVFLRTDLILGDLVEARRPDLVEGAPLYIEDPASAGGRRINRDAFIIPAGRQGTLRRNALRGFGFSQLDFALRRQINLAERVNLQLRAEFFNLLNHPNFGDPITDLGSNLFGQSIQMLGKSLGTGGVNGGLSPLYQIGGPRSVQLAVKLQF
ncbi:MAG: TonB-dependent receptor [Pyrinomonadaceae bacterium]|nr:TonB-dependent receptor [Pyrinomonadaceae bacterium]